MSRMFNTATRTEIAAHCAGFVRLAEPSNAAALKRAAVAIVIAPDASGDASMLLTLRASGLRAHSNQWALPGGRCDPGETVAQAALRELHEELGLKLQDRDVLGLLDDYPTRSGYLITPVLMWAAGDLALAPNPDEVASVHHIALASIANSAAFDFVTIPESNGRVIRYRHGNSFIHAPTAALIYQFSEMLAGRMSRVADLEQPVFAWK